MDNENKVFNSEISRVDCKEENHLYDLLTIVPAVPVPSLSPHTKNETWKFTPKNDKHYTPRKASSKLKVKTVSDIRTLFEKDMYSFLVHDLEQQQHYLLRKIRDGSSNEEKTRNMAIKLLNSDNPISRSAWQMLANINPKQNNHSKQYVLWHGKCIQVNGSKGGKTKFICNYDLKNNNKSSFTNTSNFKNNKLKSRIGLLRNSLNVKFKPGPLGKKKVLDVSHHKYQMGDLEIIKLPTPVLDISTAYGTVLDPMISNFINEMRGQKGVISKKFAEFAVSVLGTIQNNTPTQLDKNNYTTFDLNYKCHQNRLLMRRNVGEAIPITNTKNDSYLNVDLNNLTVMMQKDVECNGKSDVSFNIESDLEIQKVLNDMLSAVEISLTQDFMYSTEDESRENVIGDSKNNFNPIIKDKPKRRYCELDKLDVTVIKLPESTRKNYTNSCEKSFCTLGCVCESIDSVFSLKQHCGILDCMFGCKCQVSKYKDIELLDRDCSDIIPGLLNLDNEINSHLAKEEQKFHQTVIVSGEKSILLKSRKRNWKSSKKYAEFYRKMNLKGDEGINKKILTIDVKKISCENIEPLCMVHNLYKCFCKGKFTESFVYNTPDVNVVKTSDEHEKVKKDTLNKNVEISADRNSDSKTVIRPRLRRTYERNEMVSTTAKSDYLDVEEYYENSISCARTMVFTGRKYTNGYYMNTNIKILEMEKNDGYLSSRLLMLTAVANDDDLLSDTSNTMPASINSENVMTTALHETSIKHVDCSSNNIIDKNENQSYRLVNPNNKYSLKKWLEISYKRYKERFGPGTVKCLDAPVKGKAALQSWNFILSRYRDKRNIFYVSEEEPYRTFIAVNEHNPFLKDCIKIDQIRFADLHKYPVMVQNLVTKTTDTENSFCIMRGWDNCWELIGSAVKLIELTTEKQPEVSETIDTNKPMAQNDDDWFDKRTLNQESKSSQDDTDSNQIEQDSHSERSKWFVMTVEHDFTEIQFYKKGFFVTYDGIQRSISLARISGKTVRLSSQARDDKTDSHQFGIYAIPCISECCVFIGPYHVNEPLGIEVVKTFSDVKKNKKTRGVWITTNKIDDIKVIEHPLSFLPCVTKGNENVVTLESGPSTSTNTIQSQTLSAKDDDKKPQISLKNAAKQEILKVVKPIKIRRTNGFYHLSSKSILQKIPKNNTSSLFITNIENSNLKNNPTLVSLLRKAGDSNPTTSKPVAEVTPQVNNLERLHQFSSVTYKKPVAEIAPQVKISRVYTESHSQNDTETENNKGSGMLILKPEEINKKVLAKTSKSVDEDLAKDVEKFLVTSTICVAPDEVLVISDGEDEDIILWKDVWIECWNVENFGCIRGRKRDDNSLSFEFPGFKYSDFFTENEAFEKINQVLARKIYIPNDFTLQWQVKDEKEIAKNQMLTLQSLENKRYLLIKIREQRSKKGKLPIGATTKSFQRNKTSTSSTLYVSDSDEEPSKTKTQTNELKTLEEFEETSSKLEHHSTELWNEAVANRNEILNSLSVPDNLKVGMSETLQGIMSMNEQ